MRLSESVGMKLGGVLSPVTAMISRLRHARIFHPDGIVLRAQVDALGQGGPLGRLAERLAGPALVRLSSAWWKGDKEWPDDLGCAVRFRGATDISPEPAPGDQDLLFATIRTPFTTLPAVLTTNPHDFLANDYYAVSPFNVPELGSVKWRLVSSGASPEAGSRRERLRRAVEEGRARLRLELRGPGAFKAWTPVAELHLIEFVELDQAALRFSPFRVGRGIEPRGLVHAMRAWTYARSQAARPARTPESMEA
jgi:hypothetical protein